MSVTNGQIANQTTFNNAFMSRTQNTSTTGKVALNNTSDPDSGAAVANAQQGLNEIFDTTGMTGLADATRKQYGSTEVVADGDSRKTAIGKIDQAFNVSTGHDHSGAGKGKPISALNLINVNKYFAVFVSATKTGASGASVDVSAAMAGKTSGGTTSQKGVVTDAPNNFVHIVDSSTLTFLEDAGGQRIYGRLTYAASVWTLTFYTNEAGVETAASISSTDIKFIFWEVFDLSDRPTFPSNPAEFGTLDVTADVVDASTSLRGLISTGAQSLAGAKTWTGNQIFQAMLAAEQQVDSTTTGANQSITPTKSNYKVTHASLTSINNIASPTNGKFLVLMNGTGADLTIVKDAGGTAANRIKTGTLSDLTMKDGTAIFLVYDDNASRWQVVGGSGSGGSGSAWDWVTGDITSGVDIGLGAAWDDARGERQLWFLDSGGSGEVDLTANPQVEPSAVVGSVLLFIGCSDTDYFILDNGTGLALTGGSWYSYKGAWLKLIWDGVAWREIGRG